MITETTGISVAVIALGLGGFWTLWTRLAAVVATERAAREQVAAELAAFKLEATRSFATPGAIEKSEERLTIAIDRMTARLEMVIGRIETLSTEMARFASLPRLPT